MLAIGAFLTILGLWAAWGAWQEAGAHNIGWKWNTTFTPRVTNSGTPYGSQIESASNDYDDNTNLEVRWCVSPCNENLVHKQKYLGVGIVAGADSFSNGKQCNTSQIDCNETTNRVNSAMVVWNTASGPHSNSYANYVARHEMGHVLGLAHAPCQAAGDWGTGNGYMSVMAVLYLYDGPETLQPHDITDIDNKY